MIFLAAQFWGLVARPGCGVVSGLFSFCIRRMFSYLIRVESGKDGCCMVSSSLGSWGLRIGSFILCFACLPWLPLRDGAFVDGLVGVFLGLLLGAV